MHLQAIVDTDGPSHWHMAVIAIIVTARVIHSWNDALSPEHQWTADSKDCPSQCCRNLYRVRRRRLRHRANRVSLAIADQMQKLRHKPKPHPAHAPSIASSPTIATAGISANAVRLARILSMFAAGRR